MDDDKKYIQLSDSDVDAYKSIREAALRYAALNDAVDGVWNAFDYLAEAARVKYGIEINVSLFEEVFRQVEGELWAEIDEKDERENV